MTKLKVVAENPRPLVSDKCARLLLADPRTAHVGKAMLACSRVRPCRIPYCSRCRGPVQDRARLEASRFPRSASLRACSVHVAAIPLHDTDLLQTTLRRERDRLRKALSRAGVRLLGAWELAYKSKADLNRRKYPVLGDADHYVLLHWHALADRDVKEDLAAIYDAGPGKAFSGYRVHVTALRSTEQVEAQNWVAYAMKASTGEKSGLPGENPEYASLLAQFVHAMESIRGQGMRGLHIAMGLDSSSSCTRASVTHDDQNEMPEKPSVDEKTSLRFFKHDQSSTCISFRNESPSVESNTPIETTTCVESDRDRVRRALERLIKKRGAHTSQAPCDNLNPSHMGLDSSASRDQIPSQSRTTGAPQNDCIHNPRSLDPDRYPTSSPEVPARDWPRP